MIPFFILSRKSLKQLFITFLILLFSSITLYPQTVIKEKISLTPQNKFKNIQQVQDNETWWPCTPPPKSTDAKNPWQVVWMYSTFPLNPARQDLRSNFDLYGVDTSAYYTFKIISGGQYFHFQRDYYDGYNWYTDIYNDSIRVKGRELWPKAWDYDNEVFVTINDSIKCIDRDFAPFYISCYYYEYTIHFNGIWNREQEVVYSVTDGTTYYVHTFIKRPTYTLSTDNVRDTLLYGLKRVIPIKLEINECQNDSLDGSIPRNGSSLNDEVEFSVRITEGVKFGDLSIGNYNYGDEAVVDYYTLRKGLNFVTKYSENPDSVASVKVEITCNDPDVTPHTVSSEFLIKHNSNLPPGLLMTFDKNVLMPFDSTRIYLKLVTDNGRILDFPPFYNLNIRIEEGTNFGKLYSEMLGEYSTELYNVSADGLWYYSTQDIPQNMVDVVIYAEESGGIIAGNINPGNTIKNNPVKQMKKSNKSLQQTQSIQQVDKLETKGELQIAGPILWGETRYLGLQKKNDNSAYRIEEIPTEYGNEPVFPADAGGWKWIKKISVWSDDPISSGVKSGIYWEKKYFDKTNNINAVLKDGIIRLIGRYWEEGKEDDYKVTLKAQWDGKTIERDLKVAKPGKLGSNYNNSRDVFNNEISIDAICIETGGKNGIPPQIIKGQMQKETGFTNAYRYEPFVDISYQSNDDIKKELFDSYDYFTVTSANMGTINIPSTHTNVTPISYPNQPKKIGDFFVENIWKYIQRPNADNGNKPVVVGSETKKTGNLTDKLREYYRKLEKDKNQLTKAVDSLKNYVKSDSLKVGNKYAQTRIISSYGMLQQTFYDAHYKKLAGFSVSNSNQAPELLNEKNYSMKSYSERIGKLTKKRAGNNWSEGYENGWKKILKNYNPGEKGYEKDVVENSKSFLPVK